ncbi:energy transducer TonB [Stenotrophomonas sp. MMGLT7]|uniref:energy transducer TonB family protein n=1 Tax=Stenotrophomonas sp. MMGLT7 TaxID=2901227 RepID=UPI001E3EC313|nr:energy transducer TonB [Stenotrophomonas sp. MMGLT7]MCD7097032.1 energy transducer TonB [Stenotrophomonas sp. MMGLT7]
MEIADSAELRRWIGSLGLVLAVHAIVIGGVLWRQSHDPSPPLPASAEAVMLELAPLPTAPPAPPTDLPPGPPQQERRKAQPKAEPTPMPTPRRVPRQEQAEVAEPQQSDERHNDESADIDVARSSAPPSVQAPPGSRYAASQSSSGGAGQARATWQAQVLGHLERFKRYPRPAQRRRQEGVVLMQFSVNRQGQVLQARIARSSGHESLDAEALATVQRASPLPPPSADIPGDPVEVTTPVEFFLR